MGIQAKVKIARLDSGAIKIICDKFLDHFDPPPLLLNCEIFCLISKFPSLSPILTSIF
jgi:hypothetical protein